MIIWRQRGTGLCYLLMNLYRWPLSKPGQAGDCCYPPGGAPLVLLGLPAHLLCPGWSPKGGVGPAGDGGWQAEFPLYNKIKRHWMAMSSKIVYDKNRCICNDGPPLRGSAFPQYGKTKAGNVWDLKSDIIYSTKIYTSIISDLHEFHKYKINTILLICNDS